MLLAAPDSLEVVGPGRLLCPCVLHYHGWSGLPFPSPGGLPDPWIEPYCSSDSLPSEPPGSAGVVQCLCLSYFASSQFSSGDVGPHNLRFSLNSGI